MKKVLIGVLIAVLAVFGFNFFSAYSPLRTALKKDTRNEAVTAIAYHRWLLDPTTVVFDVVSLDGNASQMDVMRSFFLYAQQMQGRKLNAVALAHKGSIKFVLDGDDFASIGRQFATQNPVYLLRTFPSKLQRPNGTKAFSTWTGGLLGVVGKEMEDLTELGRQWYLNDLVRSR